MKEYNPEVFKAVPLRECPVQDEMKLWDTPGKAIETSEPPKLSKPNMAIRTLTIEASGDIWKGLIKPKIRLMGYWLERAGFKPGKRVHVRCVAPGFIELHSPDTKMKRSVKKRLA